MGIKVKFEGDGEEINYNSFEELIKLDNYNDIIYLKCSYNKLTSLPTLPSSLEELICRSNNLTSLPILPSSLEELSCWNNPIDKYIDNYFKGDWEKYRKFQHSVNKIGNWFLECKYNPIYRYCQRRLTKEYNELFGEE